MNYPIKKNYLIYDIIFIIALMLTILIFMNGIFSYGMHYDEVNRTNPIFPLLYENATDNDQAIWSVKIGNKVIPMMYKEYISSIRTFVYAPSLILFENPLIALRTLYIVYFAIEMIVLYVFLRRIDLKFSLLVTFLVMLNPLLYPEFKFGFAYNFHIIFIIASSRLFIKYYKSSKLRYLFTGIFILTLGANFSFYFIWNIVAIAISSLIINFDEWKKVFLNINSIIIVLISGSLGLFNYVMYNLFNNFPTIRVLLNSIFNSTDFQMDGIQSQGLFKEMIITLDKVDIMLGNNILAFSILFLSMIIVWIIITYAKYKKLIVVSKYAYYPLLILIFTISLIIISPKPRFPYHWLHISPFFEITFITGIIYISRLFKKTTISKYFITIMYAIVFVLFFSTSYTETKTDNANIPIDNISSSIYDLSDYIEGHNIDGEDILFLEWGIDAQIYFLNRGEILINRIYFIGKEKEEIERVILTTLKNCTSKNLYIPLYNSTTNALSYSDTKEGLIKVASNYGFDLTTEKEFVDKNGRNAITLYKIENANANYLERVNLYSQKIANNEIVLNSSTNYEIKGNIDNISIDNKYFSISGWAFAKKYKIDSIVICDNDYKVIKICNYGLLRNDVYDVFMEKNATNSGFSINSKLNYNSDIRIIVITENNKFIEMDNWKI